MKESRVRAMKIGLHNSWHQKRRGKNISRLTRIRGGTHSMVHVRRYTFGPVISSRDGREVETRVDSEIEQGERKKKER